MATMNDVARHANVSIATVDAAVSSSAPGIAPFACNRNATRFT